MSVPKTAGAPPGRSFARFWLPLLLLALYGLAEAAVWKWPAPEWPQVIRTLTAESLTLLLGLLLALWFVALSGVRLWVRLVVVAAGVGALVILPRVLIRDMHFSGNMVPVVHWVWETPRNEALEAWRREHQEAKVTPAGDLSGDRPTDYPGYRGRERNAVVRGPELARAWKTPPRQVWRHPCGGGYAGFAIAGNSAVTLEQRGDQEAVVCYDTDTGLERWAYAYAARFSEQMGGTGPRATPTIVDGDVYALGAQGNLVRLDAATGKSKWEVHVLEDNDNLMWGMSGSPLVYDRFVVVNPGKQKTSAKYGALTAFDRETHEPVWNAGDTRAGYSSPMVATLAGQRQVLLFDGEGLGGYDADKGTRLWWYTWTTNQGINVAQPLVLPGDRVFITSGYGVGCAMLRVTHDGDQWSVKPLWDNKYMRCQFTSPVADDRYLYGLDQGILVCLDQKDGGRKWRGERYNNGQLLRAGDLLLIQAEDGDLALVEATGDGSHELGRFPALEGNTWNCPVLADGRAYVRNDHEMACYDLRAP